MRSQREVPECLLSNNLETIKAHLILQKKELLAELAQQQGNLGGTDPFPEITTAIEHVENLKSIQGIIETYWYRLENFG